MRGARSAARRGRWLPLALMLAGLVAVTCAFVFLREGVFYALFSESGAVETVTSLLYLALVGVLLTRRSRLALGLTPAFLAALLLARETDQYLRFNGRTIFAAKFYTDPLIPLVLKIVLLAGFAVLAVAAGAFLIRIAPHLIAALRRRSAFVFPLLWAAALIGLSLVLDRASQNMQALFSITLPSTGSLYLTGVEELAELLIPAMLLLAAWEGLAQSSGPAA